MGCLQEVDFYSRFTRFCLHPSATSCGKILPSFLLLCSHKSLRVFLRLRTCSETEANTLAFTILTCEAMRSLVSPRRTLSDLQPNEGSKPADMLLQLFERRLGPRRAEDVITLSKQKSAYWDCHISLEEGGGSALTEAAQTISFRPHPDHQISSELGSELLYSSCNERIFRGGFLVCGTLVTSDMVLYLGGQGTVSAFDPHCPPPEFQKIMLEFWFFRTLQTFYLLTCLSPCLYCPVCQPTSSSLPVCLPVYVSACLGSCLHFCLCLFYLLTYLENIGLNIFFFLWWRSAILWQDRKCTF